MNLLEMLKLEVSSLGLKNKLEIANYLYKRTGEIFEYNPWVSNADAEEKKKIRRKRINIRNVEDFFIVCESWAYMFEDLLHEFSIFAKAVSKDGYHVYVIVKEENRNYRFDLTLEFEDLMKIKFGMNPKYNYKREEENKNQVELALQQLKINLLLKKRQLKMGEEEYIYAVFQLIQKLLKKHTSESNVGYVSGNKYIEYLLNFFIGENYKPCYTKFYNRNLGIFFRIYVISKNGNPCYFVYQPTDDGEYEFQEVSVEAIQYWITEYKTTKPYNLVLRKKRSSY